MLGCGGEQYGVGTRYRSVIYGYDARSLGMSCNWCRVIVGWWPTVVS